MAGANPPLEQDMRLSPARLSLPFCLWLLLTGATAPIPVTCYIHAHWWSGERFASGLRCASGGRFVPRPARPARIVDLGGSWIVPPFADAHNHMAAATSEVSDKAIAAGIFYLMNPTLLASAAPGIRRTLAAPGRIDVALSMGAITAHGGHPEGLYQDVLRKFVYPNIKPEDFVGDAFHYVDKASDIEPVLDRLVAQHADFVKIILMFSEEFEKRKDDPAYREKKGLDPRLVRPLVQAAHRRGLRVAAHIETAADFRTIVAAGVDEAAHMPGYYGGDGPIQAYEINAADARAAARSGIKVVTTASYALHLADHQRLAAVRAVQRANLLKLKRAGVPILIGTDGVPDAAVGEARYLIELGVFTPKEALNALSRTTPAFIFPKRRLGRLESGYEASFIGLGADPTSDPAALAHVTVRVKQGTEITLPPNGGAVTLAITGVNLVSMEDGRIARGRTILVAGKRIAAIGAGLRVPPGIKLIDGKGRFAIPGLWDMHVHVLAEAPNPAAFLAVMLREGIVGVRDMGSTLEQLRQFRAAPAAKTPLPELIAAGPVVNGPSTPWSRSIEMHVAKPDEAETVVAQLAAGGAQFVKVYSGLDRASYAAVVAAARRRAVVVAGHLPFALSLDEALNAGQRSIEHMEVHLSKSCGEGDPAKAADRWLAAWIGEGFAGRYRTELALRRGRDAGRCRALLARLASAPLWWTPTLVLDFADATFLDEDFRRFSTTQDVRDCQAFTGKLAAVPPKLRARALRAELQDVALLHSAGVHLLAGTDMPRPCNAPVASLRRELRLMVRAGLTPYQALRTATVEPASYLGRGDAGTLATGKIADIVLLDRNPLRDIRAVGAVDRVVARGRLVG
jgi:imidazolonepropionase-like amidohydrolase